MQGVEGILSDGAFIGVAPYLQTNQSHPDVEGPVKLRMVQSGVRSKLNMSYILCTDVQNTMKDVLL